MADDLLRDRTLALAGLAQAAELVQDLARTGKVDQKYFDTCARTLFTFDVQTVEEVYGGISSLGLGLRSLQGHFFKPKSPVQAEIMRYAFQLIQLSKKVKSSSQLSQQLAEQLDHVHLDEKQSFFDEQAIEEIAEIYLKTISPLKPRVIVSGEQGYLAQKQTAAKVRVCLLSGIRSAYLWLQKGGSKLQLLTARGAYQNQATSLLAEMV